MMDENTAEHPFLLTVERMLSMIPNLTPDEKAELEAWEKVNLGSGGKGTTDWPGWTAVVSRLSH